MELMVQPKKPMDSPATDASAASRTPRERFSLLMREHHRGLLVYARAIVKDHHAAQDIVQDAFVAAYRTFPTYEEDRDFGKWMRGIVQHKCLDWFRKQKRLPLPDTDLVDLELDIFAWQEARESGKASLFEALEDCLSLLPEKLRETVEAFYLHENSGEETAAKLNIPAATVRKRLERAREKLYECLTAKAQPGDMPSAS